MPLRNRASLSLLCRGVRLVSAVLIVACLSVSPPRAAAQSLQLETTAGGHLVLHRLPAVLDHHLVQVKLTTGLTTTFYFRVGRDRRRPSLGGAEISLRYDLWEEVFLLTIRDGLGATRTESQPANRLEEWWSELRIPAAARSSLPEGFGAGESSPKLQVSLTVLPFSSSELADTKRWFSRTGATGWRRSTEPENVAGASSHLFDLLLGTSLERKALLSKSWTVRVTGAKREESP